jgi:hypothetical protein
MRNLDTKSYTENQKDIKKFVTKMNDEAKAQGLPSWVELMARQDPAMADIMARMIKAELSNRESRLGCDLCATQQHNKLTCSFQYGPAKRI